MLTWAVDINTDPTYIGTMDLETANGHTLGLIVTVVQGGCVGLSDKNGPNRCVVLGIQHGLKWWPRPWAVTMPSMVIRATVINRDTGCSRAAHPDIAPGHSLAQTSLWSLEEV